MNMRSPGIHFERLEDRRLLTLMPVGPEAVVPGGDQVVAADVAVAADGSYLIASAVATGTTANITAVRYSPAGVVVGPPLTLDSTGTAFLGIGSSPIAASVDADGDAVVAYRRDAGMYVVRLSKDGVASTPLRVDATPAERFVHEPTVSMDDAGGFFVGWLEQADRWNLVQVRAFDADGAPRGTQFSPRSSDHLDISYFDLDLAARPDGSGAVFAFTNSSGEGGSSVLFGRTSATALLGSLGSVGFRRSDVAVHSDGSFVIGYGSGADIGMRAQRYDAAGNPIGNAIALDDLVPMGGLDSRTHSVSVETMPDGGFVAAFVYTTRVGGSINPERDVSTIYARRYDAAGAPDAADPIVLNATPYDNHGSQERYIRPHVAPDSDGSVVAVYVQPTSPSNETYVGPAYQRRLTVRVARLAGAELYVDGTEGDDHIIIERVRQNLFVNVNGIVERFNAADVQFLTINGFGGDDDVDNATAIPSTIHGGDGHDTIWGGTGADRILGLGGDDFLRGGDGDDTVFGNNGGDSLNGGDGSDHLSGDAGEDSLYGSSGNDLLRGHRGSDSLYGEAGDDTLDGGDASDYFEGGAGHDALIGGGGADRLFGLAGNDRIHAAGDGFGDTVRGALGIDCAEVDELDDVLGVEGAS